MRTEDEGPCVHESPVLGARFLHGQAESFSPPARRSFSAARGRLVLLVFTGAEAYV